MNDIDLQILAMYYEDGMKEKEIAESLGLSLLTIHEILAARENGDDDEISDSEKLTRIAVALRRAYELVEEGSEAHGYIAEALAYADGDMASFDGEDKA
jgi:DNA-binding transcriptional regulator LsrR (DeoR family)